MFTAVLFVIVLLTGNHRNVCHFKNEEITVIHIMENQMRPKNTVYTKECILCDTDNAGAILVTCPSNCAYFYVCVLYTLQQKSDEQKQSSPWNWPFL